MQLYWQFTYIILLAAFTALNVAAQAQITSYPPRMYGDSLHAPFYHGVASGDPLPNAVLLWTRITPDSTATGAIALNWQIATDTSFNNIVASGTAQALPTKDYTLTVDATGLSPNTVYYYRFQTPGGQFSRRGRTKTAPVGNVSQFRLAVLSCSSVYSGYFNAYARLGERDDIDLVVHLGDYIYDFVDEDEEIRVPTPYPADPQTLEEWRDRHEYYLLDPDLREARAQHPWVVMWDNHDLERQNPILGQQAFTEWVPVRVPDTTQLGTIYRRLVFGDIVDLHMLDILNFRNIDLLPNGDFSLLGNDQYNWFVNSWQASTTKWKLIGSQKMSGGWYSYGLPTSIIPHNGTVFDTGSWDGFFEERRRLFAFFDSLDSRNNIFISGDAHISMAMDLAIDPFDSLQYNHVTGQGGVGVEFLPTSISRGNFDEMGIDPGLAEAAVSVSKDINLHHVYMEVLQHGYGVLTLTPDSVMAEFWYSPILQQSNTEVLGQSLVVEDGAGHWKRNLPISRVPDFATGPSDLVSLIRPNPAKDWIEFDVKSTLPGEAKIMLFNIAGRNIPTPNIRSSASGNTYLVDVAHLPPGIYMLQVATVEGTMIRQFVVGR